MKQQEKETGITLIIADAGSNIQKPNAAVVSVEARSSADDIARKIYNFTVKVGNFSTQENNTVLGMYTSDDKLVDETQVKLGPNAEKELRLLFRPGESGWHGGYFRIEDDVLTPDNTRYFALYMREALRIGVLDESDSTGIGYDRSFFLSRTIDPLEQGYPFLVDRLTGVAADVISKYDIIVMCGASKKAGSIAIINEYVGKGGKVLVFLNGDVPADFANDILGKDVIIGQQEKGIFKIGKESFGLSNLFLEVDVYERMPLSISEDADSLPLALFQDGKPFVLERPFGKGTVIAVSTGYDVDATNLPLRHASVPFIYQLLFKLVKEHEVKQYLCGDLLKIGPAWSSIAYPDGAIQQLSDNTNELPLNGPGLHVAREEKAGGIATAYIAAVNPDTAESDLTRTNYEEIGRLAPFARWDIISREQDIRQIIERYSRGTPLWNYFLYAAILCFFSELLLANRTGMRV